MKSMAELTATFPRKGTVTWIGLSPGRREPLTVVSSVRAEVGTGLDGDRHARSGRSKREVTLIQAEHLPVIASLAGRPVSPGDLRRNLMVEGINVYALRKARFRVGKVLLEGTGLCDPCSRMEENLGPGGFNACRGHGGITARVIEAGEIALGDAVCFEHYTAGFTAKADLH